MLANGEGTVGHCYLYPIPAGVSLQALIQHSKSLGDFGIGCHTRLLQPMVAFEIHAIVRQSVGAEPVGLILSILLL